MSTSGLILTDSSPNIVWNEYALFSGSTYYPFEGWHDFKGVFSSIEESKEFFLSMKSEWEGPYSWAQIVSLRNLEIVLEFSSEGDKDEPIWEKYENS